jgi:hypothetical protein
MDSASLSVVFLTITEDGEEGKKKRQDVGRHPVF